MGLTNCTRPTSYHITPLVINDLRGGHTRSQTHTHTHTHTHTRTHTHTHTHTNKNNLRKPGTHN